MRPGIIVKSMDFRKLRKLQRKSPEMFEKAMEKGAIQFLDWANNGSSKESRKPPIREGTLRGSASAFVGNKLVAIAPSIGGEPTPASSYNGNPLTITWAWNTNYAHRMHEHKGKWGKFTKQDGDAGNKWLEKHLTADKEDLISVIKKEFFALMERGTL